MAGDIMLLGFLAFIVGLFVKNRKWKKIFIYGGLAIALIMLVAFFDEIRQEAIDAYKAGYEDARDVEKSK